MTDAEIGQLLARLCPEGFTAGDVMDEVDGGRRSMHAVKAQISTWYRRGWVDRIRPGIYVVVAEKFGVKK